MPWHADSGYKLWYGAGIYTSGKNLRDSLTLSEGSGSQRMHKTAGKLFDDKRTYLCLVGQSDRYFDFKWF